MLRSTDGFSLRKQEIFKHRANEHRCDCFSWSECLLTCFLLCTCENPVKQAARSCPRSKRQVYTGSALWTRNSCTASIETHPIHSNRTGGGSWKSDSGRPYTSPIAPSPRTSATADACESEKRKRNYSLSKSSSRGQHKQQQHKAAARSKQHVGLTSAFWRYVTCSPSGGSGKLFSSVDVALCRLTM